jgi:hypothetical protein
MVASGVSGLNRVWVCTIKVWVQGVLAVSVDVSPPVVAVMDLGVSVGVSVGLGVTAVSVRGVKVGTSSLTVVPIKDWGVSSGVPTVRVIIGGVNGVTVGHLYVKLGEGVMSGSVQTFVLVIIVSDGVKGVGVNGVSEPVGVRSVTVGWHLGSAAYLLQVWGVSTSVAVGVSVGVGVGVTTQLEKVTFEDCMP